MATSFRHPDVVDIPGALGAWWRSLRVAASFLTCLPTGPRSAGTATTVATGGDRKTSLPAGVVVPDLTRALTAFPLVGAGIGVVSALVLLAAFELGLHPLACALLAVATGVAITGALHEDGLADFADGLGVRGTPEDRLAIMRDSHIGSFGTLALIFGVGMRAAILSGLSSPGVAAASLVCAATLSRAVLPAVMRWQQPARGDGLSAGIGMPTAAQVALAGASAVIICLLAVGFWATLAVAISVAIATLAVAGIAQRTLGGQTGDVLGAVQVVAEVAALAAIAAAE